MTNNQKQITLEQASEFELEYFETTITDFIIYFHLNNINQLKFAAKYGLINNEMKCVNCGEKLKLFKKNSKKTKYNGNVIKLVDLFLQ